MKGQRYISWHQLHRLKNGSGHAVSRYAKPAGIGEVDSLIVCYNPRGRIAERIGIDHILGGSDVRLNIKKNNTLLVRADGMKNKIARGSNTVFCTKRMIEKYWPSGKICMPRN